MSIPANDECGPAAAVSLLPAERASCLAAVFKALGDPTRVRLVSHIAAADGGTACACHLPQALGISQPTLSHHLKKLTDAGVLTREQRGRWAHFTVNAAVLDVVRDYLDVGLTPASTPCC